MMRPQFGLGVAVAGIALLSAGYLTEQHAALAQSQIEMDDQAANDFARADRQLNIVYKHVLAGYSGKDESVTRKKIVAAERAWIVYRDAEADMDASMQAEGGSLYPQIYDTSRADATRDRIKMIQAELKEINSR